MPDTVARTPEEALAFLREGNERFLAGAMRPRNFAARVLETSDHQAPFAAVLGCVDSRVPHEIVFDQGLGDIFSARVAGNSATPEIIGSLEFATHVAGAKLIVILGHSKCGAVKAACDRTRFGNLTATLSHLDPAVKTADPGGGPRDSSNADYVRAVALTHIRVTIEVIRVGSEIIRNAVDAGEVGLVGAFHDVCSGRVEFFEESG